MNTPRDPDTIVASWLDEGPTDIPDETRRSIAIAARTSPQAHSPFDRLARRIDMSRFQTLGLVAAVAIVAVVGIVALSAFGGEGSGIGGQPTQASPSPASPEPSEPTGPPLSETFVSPGYGYSIGYPAGWSIDPGDQAWLSGGLAGEGAGDIIAEEFSGSPFVSVSSQLLAGQSGDDWATALSTDAAWGDSCPITTEPVTIGGASGILVIHCPDDGVQSAFVSIDDRGYFVVGYQLPSLAYFKEFLATVELRPERALPESDFALPELTQSFTSPSYGYTIRHPAGWSVIPAKTFFDPLGPEGIEGREPLDVIHPLVSNGLFRAASAAIPEGGTADDILRAYWGVQSDLEDVTIGGQPGRLREGDGEAEAAVVVGHRVYVFTLFAGLFGDEPGLTNGRALFDAMMASVELHPEDALAPAPAGSSSP